MAATVAVDAPAPAWPVGTSAPPKVTASATARATAGPVRGRQASRPRPLPGRRLMISQASVAATAATRNVSQGTPPIATQPAVGFPAWLMASRPQPNPPNGQRLRSASSATHHRATAAGQIRRFSSSRRVTAVTEKISASPPASAAKTYQATLIIQVSMGRKNAAPKTSPTSIDPRKLRRHSATTSSAGPTAASGHTPAGGNAAASDSPPASATRSAVLSRSASRPGGILGLLGMLGPAGTATGAAAAAVGPGSGTAARRSADSAALAAASSLDPVSITPPVSHPDADKARVSGPAQ